MSFERYLCPDCGTELKDSSSERGFKFCPECTAPVGRRQAIEVFTNCICCQREFRTPNDVAMCEDCIEHDCLRGDVRCMFRRATTEPDDCEHKFFRVDDPGFDRECPWCGLVE